MCQSSLFTLILFNSKACLSEPHWIIKFLLPQNGKKGLRESCDEQLINSVIIYIYINIILAFVYLVASVSNLNTWKSPLSSILY